MRRFVDKVVVVTGGAGGIGAATVRRFAAEGAKVAILDVGTPSDALTAGLAEAIIVSCDVGDPHSAELAVKVVLERYGRIDVLFNNAGIGIGGETPDVSPDDWNRVMQVNVGGVFHLCRVVIPAMRRQGGGVIINNASISGLAADFGAPTYNASKGAIINYTRSLALDHARDGIRVNVLCPGLILGTALSSIVDRGPVGLDGWLRDIPLGRAGTCDEMAGMVAFLASDDAAYMTGSVVVADGGRTAQTGQPNAPRAMREANASA